MDSSLCTAAEALKDEGAIKVVAYITHAVFSGPAIERISASNIDEVVVTDTIPLCEAATNCSKIKQLSLDRLLAEAIRRVSNEESITDHVHRQTASQGERDASHERDR